MTTAVATCYACHAEQVHRHAYVLGRLAATVHFYFTGPASPTPFEPSSRFSSVLDVRHSQAFYQRLQDAARGMPWFDFVVRRLEDCGSGAPVPKRRGTFLTTPTWLLEELKPARLASLHESLLAISPSKWRDEVADLVLVWVENSLYVVEHARLSDSIVPLSDRLAFEFHSYLCGIGETSSSWNSQQMSESPHTWFRETPRLLSFAFHGDQDRTRLLLRIPLFASTEDRCCLADDARAIVEVFADVARIPLGGESKHALDALYLACGLQLEIELVGRASYRVCSETLVWDIAANRHSSEDDPGAAVNPVSVPCSDPWWIDWLRRCVSLPSSNNSAGVLRTRRVVPPPSGALRTPMASGQGSPRTLSPSRSPTKLPLPTPSSPPPHVSLAVECPSFVSSHRQSNATLMEFVPLLEAHIREEILREPLHFCLLVKALTASWGPAAVVSAVVEPSKRDEDSSDDDEHSDAVAHRRYCVFLLQDSVTKDSVSVTVTYEGVRTLPSAMVCSTQHEMPYQAKALCAKARLVLPRDPPSDGKPYNVAEVAEALRNAVMQRFLQMIAIMQLHAKEESEARAAQKSMVVSLPLEGAHVHVDPTVDCVAVTQLSGSMGAGEATTSSVPSVPLAPSQSENMVLSSEIPEPGNPSSSDSFSSDAGLPECSLAHQELDRPSSDEGRAPGDHQPSAPATDGDVLGTVEREPSASAPPED